MTTRRYTITIAAEKTLSHEGHTYELRQLSREGAWALRCVDLAEGEDAEDLSWPRDEAVTKMAERPLRFSDVGDDNVEVIYQDALPVVVLDNGGGIHGAEQVEQSQSNRARDHQ